MPLINIRDEPPPGVFASATLVNRAARVWKRTAPGGTPPRFELQLDFTGNELPGRGARKRLIEEKFRFARRFPPAIDWESDYRRTMRRG